MALKAGTFGNFSGSMAEAMEQAFQSEWNATKSTALGDHGEEDRRILFAAIAQGVIGYLKDNIEDALQIDVEVEQNSGNNISSSNGSVTVTQQSGSSNRVQSQGQASGITLATE
jgi:hypothetical protein